MKLIIEIQKFNLKKLGGQRWEARRDLLISIFRVWDCKMRLLHVIFENTYGNWQPLSTRYNPLSVIFSAVSLLGL